LVSPEAATGRARGAAVSAVCGVRIARRAVGLSRDVVDPTLPAAADQNTSDITASTYEQELDSLDEEVADLN
jgi:hypothetical protein